MQDDAAPTGSPSTAQVLWQEGPWTLVRLAPDAREAYDAFVGAHAHGDFLQGWSWGDLKAKGGWRPHRLALVRDGQWIAAASLLERPLPLGATLLYAPRGPVLDYADPTLLTAFLGGVRAAMAGRPVLLKMDPDVPDDAGLAQRLRQIGLRPGRVRGLFGGIQPRHVMRLRLDRPLDAVFASFTPKGRYNIRLAERRGVVVEEAGREALPMFWEMLRETSARDGFGVRPGSYYADVFDHTVGRGQGRVLLARIGDAYVAGTWTVHLGDKAWYLYGASTSRYRELMPNYLLQWEAIRWAHGRGAKLYDFLGVPATPDPRSRIIGLWRFKERFAPDVTHFIGEYDLPLRPAAYALWRLADPLFARSVVALGGMRRVVGAVRRRAGPRVAPVPSHP